MRSRWFLGVVFIAAALVAASPAIAQEFRGRVNGAVTDSSGAVLPGVTVTASGPALIRPQVAVTGEDGTYRLIALPAGVYELTFELAGFRTVKREGIRVIINQTLTVNGELEVATIQETVTVSGASPVVDTSTTAVGTNFTKELLTDIPNARDIWAAMAQAPGFHMQGFDVGGSHTGTQTQYMTYGVGEQNQTHLDGIDVTEGTDANGGYMDFGSFEEFQIGTAGNLADQKVPGASLNVTIKSGGDRLSGTWYSDWEGKNLISDNVPGEFRQANVRDDNGFFRRTPLSRGNPIDHQYDLNGQLGGPIKRGKAWFFYSYRINNQYAFILGEDVLAQSKLPQHTIKGTYQLTRNNQLIGLYNNREKLQPLRGLSPNRPVSTAWWQQSRFVPFKGEWTSVLSDRLFLDVMLAYRWNPVLFAPTTSPQSGAFPLEQWVPGRTEITTGQLLSGGANDSYLAWNNRKPHLYASLAYFKDRWAGTHDFKFGIEIQRDQRTNLEFHPFGIHYRDRNGVPVEVDILNTPDNAKNRVNRRTAYVNDTWKLAERFTLNLGLRMDRYTDGWPDETQTPSGVPVLASDPRFTGFFAAKKVSARTVAKHVAFAPRIGGAYDMAGDGKKVVKLFYGRFYFNSDNILANKENPVGAARIRAVFTDLNGNRIIDGPAEVGRTLSTSGGGGFIRIDPDLKRPFGEEISAHFESELRPGFSGRFSYVYKNIRDDWAEVDFARVNAYTIPVNVIDLGQDGVTGTGDDKTLQVFDRLPTTPSDRVFTNPDDYKSDYHTVEAGVNRRLRDRWMLLASFGYTWLTQFYGVDSSNSEFDSAGNFKQYFWQPNQRAFGRETTTLWNYKIIGRYELPWEIGLSGSYKVQSGRQWGRSLSIRLAGAGTETIRVEPANANRAPDVDILDVRLDKSFALKGRYGRLTGMVDVFNVLNRGTVTGFRTATATNFLEVTQLLGPRIVRLGIRYEF